MNSDTQIPGNAEKMQKNNEKMSKALTITKILELSKKLLIIDIIYVFNWCVY